MNENELCCLSHWFPKIEAAGVPVPRTEIVCTDINLFPLCDGKLPDGWGSFLADLSVAIARLTDNASPTPPVFLRTGQGSGKHSWSDCCYVDFAAGSVLARHVGALVEWSSMVDMVGLPVNVWAVREMLPTRPLFRCTRYGNFPVVREFRVFVDGSQVLYRVPYWPDGAIEQGRPDTPIWAAMLATMNRVADSEHRKINRLASAAGAAVGGQWSVDVLDTDRGWFVTDMAVAERSYGWEGITLPAAEGGQGK